MERENKYELKQSSDSNSWGKVEIKPESNQKCPRCDSVETKFCYFNNSKTSQPRYVCKNCKRFWTHGGNVRNKDKTEMNAARDFSSSGGGASGNLRRVGTLNLTRPQKAANLPQLEFVCVDINSLSFAQGFSRVLNPYVASPQGQALAQGHMHPVRPSGQYHQANYGHLGMAWREPSCPNTAQAGDYMEPPTFWDNNHQIGHNCGGLARPPVLGHAELPGYSDVDAFLASLGNQGRRES